MPTYVKKAMLPEGFKKDSRVWLHKNAHPYPNKTGDTNAHEVKYCTSNCKCHCQKNVEDQNLLTQPSPFITDSSGRVFKKDSRTWLHKSSVRKLAKSVTNGAIRLVSGARAARRFKENKQQHRADAEPRGPEAGGGALHARSSTDLHLTQHTVNTLKTRDMAETMGHGDLSLGDNNIVSSITESEVAQKESIRPRYQPGICASYHGIKSKANDREINAYTSDYCITTTEVPCRVYGCSDSDTESDYRTDAESDDNQNDQGADIVFQERHASNLVTEAALRSRGHHQRYLRKRHSSLDREVVHDVSQESFMSARSNSKDSLNACLSLSEN